MSKWIRFELLNTPERKTSIVRVVAIQGSCLLGEIKWYGAWRKYCFFPAPNLMTIFEEDCLRDIAQFCEEATRAHRESKRTVVA